MHLTILGLKKHTFVRDTWTRVGYAGHPQLVDVLGAINGSCGREPYPHTSSPRPQPHWYPIPVNALVAFVLF